VANLAEAGDGARC